MVDMLMQLIGLVFSILLLAKAGDILVKSIANIASCKKWSEFTVSFLLASATSFPELAVCLTAALNNEPNLAMGNILGSNIANVTIVVGLIAVVGGSIRVTVREKKEDSLYAAAVTLLPLVLIIDGAISRVDGIILLLGYIFYVYRLYKFRSEGTYKLKKPKRPLSTFVIHFLFGMAVMLLASKALVSTASSTAQSLGLPLVFVGLFIVGFGTSLPELFFGMRAALKHKGQMVLGDILGSIISNAGFILGLTALVAPIKIVSFSVVYSSAIFLVLSIFAFTYFLHSEYRLTRTEGTILTLLFIIFMSLEFGLGMI